jgi:hypothetical protein
MVMDPRPIIGIDPTEITHIMPSIIKACFTEMHYVTIIKWVSFSLQLSWINPDMNEWILIEEHLLNTQIKMFITYVLGTQTIIFRIAAYILIDMSESDRRSKYSSLANPRFVKILFDQRSVSGNTRTT